MAHHLDLARDGRSYRRAFEYGGHHWTIRFNVASYERYTARVGTYDAFRIIDTVEADGER